MAEVVFRTYRKVTPTVARILTERDYDAYHGIIETAEGPCGFLPGDSLGMDANGVWPIPVEDLRTHYKRVGETTNEAGFARYQPLGTRLAAQMEEPFAIDGLKGRAGDYWVKGQGREWPVEREMFESSYTLVE